MLFQTNFFQGSAKDIWSEVSDLGKVTIAASQQQNNRTARQSGYGGAESPGAGAHQAAGSCDSCCLPGPPGKII